MTDQELQTLLDDDEFLNEFFLGLDGAENFVKGFGEIMKGHYKQAEKNQKTKEDMNEYYERNKELYSIYQEKKEIYDELKEKEQEIKENLGAEKVEEALDDRIQELEKEVKRVKKDDLDIDEFIENYRVARKEVLKYQIMKQKIFPE